MSWADLMKAIDARFPGAIVSGEERDSGWGLVLSPAHLVEVCEFLRDESEPRFDLLVTVTYAHGRVCYQLVSSTGRRRLAMCVPILEERSSDKRPAVDSVSFVWPAADWAEREVHDLWGVEFRGHRGLAPLLVRDPLAPTHPTDLPGDGSIAVGMRYPTTVDGLFLRLGMAGGRVVAVQPELGYRHSGLGKWLATWPYERGTLLAARVDGFSAMHGDLAYALAAEELLGVKPPPRAQRLRVIYAEMQRIASHLSWLVRLVQGLSDPLLAASAYAWEARTAILDLFQLLGGNPITPDVTVIGGLKCDAPPAFPDALCRALDDAEVLLDDLSHVLGQNPAFRSRLRGVGVIDPGTALGLGMTGPNLRASGVRYDVRAAFPYASYDELDLQISVESSGDADARFQVRMGEMRTSARLIRDAMSQLPEGEVNALAPGELPAVLPAGTAYASAEGARGELGVLLVSDGSGRLEHAHVRGPSFANLSALPFLCRGLSPEQVATALDSLDISMGEVER